MLVAATFGNTCVGSDGKTNMTVHTSLDEWLDGLPVCDGYASISSPRRFKHDETAYDAQYGNEPANLDAGRGAVGFAREFGIDTSGPALEIGCGTGLLSLGLVNENLFPGTLLTDPSPVFLEITRKKLENAHVATERTRFALLQGEDTERLPEGMFSLIALRSTLHHILDVERFFQHIARALRPGGVVVFQEPCMEGFVLMGALAQFMPSLGSTADRPMTDSQRIQVSQFTKTMQFYIRQDLDKSNAEDKHVFRVDELMAWANGAGLTLKFIPNVTFEHFAYPPWLRPAPDRFRMFFYDYLKYCMSFDDALMARFDEHLGPYCDWLDKLCEAGSPPYLHGVFLAHRP